LVAIVGIHSLELSLAFCPGVINKERKEKNNDKNNSKTNRPLKRKSPGGF
jgi:hypothetical protein